MSGWWLGHPSEKHEFVNWDDEISNIWENKKLQPNHQPDVDIVILFIWISDQFLCRYTGCIAASSGLILSFDESVHFH